MVCDAFPHDRHCCMTERSLPLPRQSHSDPNGIKIVPTSCIRDSRKIGPRGNSCIIGGLPPLTDRRSRMISTGTEALRQITAALATLLDAPAMLALCREGG